MIKKLLFILGGVILLFALTIVVFLMNLSAVGSYVVKKVTGGEVDAARFDYSYDSGHIVLKLADLTIKGNLQGTVKRLDIYANLWSRPFLKSTIMSDFDLTLLDIKGKTRFIPLPAELLEIKGGAITYSKQRIFIDALTIEKLKSGKPFLLTLKARNESTFKTITISGEGIYKGKSTELKGNLHIVGIDLARLSRNLKGAAVIHGPFTFANQSFSFTGPFEITGFEVRDRALKKPLAIERYAGQATVDYANAAAEVGIKNIGFLKTTFSLNLKADKDNLISLDLSSGFIDVNNIKDFISPENVARGSHKLWEAIQEGKVRIARFHHEKKKPLYADVELKDLDFVYRDMNFRNVEALLSIDNHRVTITKGRGEFKSSHFSDAEGFVSLAHDKEVKVKGNYMVNLVDIPYMLDVGEVRFRRGITQGVMELFGNMAQGYKIRGNGKIDNGAVSWKKISASARGSYHFTDDEITFDPLIVRKAGTDLKIRGKWSKKSLGIFMKGSLDVDDIKTHIFLPWSVNGVASVDGSLRRDGKVLALEADAIMDNISFTIPQFLTKDRGVRSKTHIKATYDNKQANIEQFSYNLDGIDVSGTGTIGYHSILNFHLAVTIPDFERVAPLFFFQDTAPKGNLDLNLVFKDVKWPLTKIPAMTGFVRVNNGFINLPWFSKPLKEINLSGDFKGDAFEIHASRLVYGKTILDTSKLTVVDVEKPRFSLSLAMNTLDISDFTDESSFVIRSMSPKGILANASGDFVVRADSIKLPNMTGNQLLGSGDLRQRQVNLHQLTANLMGGYAHIKGSANLAGKVPRMNIEGKLSSITGGHFLRALGAQSSVVDGEGAITGNLQFDGGTKAELLESLEGSVGIYSRNGAIRKWNLLAKVFGLLNLYDLFRGKVQFTEAGLPYSKMGASFAVEKGVFSTNNFLIDSPSMLITGSGSIDTTNGEISGDINVSPFVTVDRTIDKIPVIRRLLRSRERGLIYASYHVTGNVEEPEIKTNYVSTIGGRAVETLKNILTLPQDLFERKQ